MDEPRRDESGEKSDAPPPERATPDPSRRRAADPAVPSTSALAGMGVQFLVAVLLCLFAGKWLDARLGTAPLLMVLGVLVGAGASIRAMYRKVFPVDK
jgi:F0F1-type ATP synthase assembly protein I